MNDPFVLEAQIFREVRMQKYRQQIMRNSLGAMALRRVEAKLKHRIEFKATDGDSEWDEDENVISINRRSPGTLLTLLNGGSWRGRIVFHELGHAVISAFWSKMDQGAFRRIYDGIPNHNYPEGVRARVKALIGGIGKTAVTRYGKMHADEAWAEAFSHVVCNVEDHELDPEQIEQLAYVDWVLENLESNKRSWGKFKGYTQEVECAECGEDFDVDCRRDGDMRGWTIDCPECGETLVCR